MDGYRIVRLMGSGGSADIYEAIHVGLRKRVALKILRPEMAAIPESQARLMREGEACARVQHPHIIDITDNGVHGTSPYLVMEYLQGNSLEELLRAEFSLSIGQTLKLLLPIFAAVQASHRAGVVHRDLKPDNIFLSIDAMGRSVPKLLDFGVSQLDCDDTQELDARARILGTAEYMSPEQARGELRQAAATDQYALGVILYECLTGLLPRNADTVVDLLQRVGRGDPFPKPTELAHHLPPEMEAVILRAMAYETSDRFPNVATMACELLYFLDRDDAIMWNSFFVQAGQPACDPRRIRSSYAYDAGDSTIERLSGIRRASVPPSADASGVVQYGQPEFGHRVRHDDTAATLAPPAERRARTARVVTIGLLFALVLSALAWAWHLAS